MLVGPTHKNAYVLLTPPTHIIIWHYLIVCSCLCSAWLDLFMFIIISKTIFRFEWAPDRLQILFIISGAFQMGFLKPAFSQRLNCISQKYKLFRKWTWKRKWNEFIHYWGMNTEWNKILAYFPSLFSKLHALIVFDKLCLISAYPCAIR